MVVADARNKVGSASLTGHFAALIFFMFLLLLLSDICCSHFFIFYARLEISFSAFASSFFSAWSVLSRLFTKLLSGSSKSRLIDPTTGVSEEIFAGLRTLGAFLNFEILLGFGALVGLEAFWGAGAWVGTSTTSLTKVPIKRLL